MAEKEYIEREAVINHIDFVVDNSIDTDYQKAAWGFGIFVSRLPAADVEPVRHGEWASEETAVTCTACGRSYDTDFEIKRNVILSFDYCPNCGAKMDGGAENAKHTGNNDNLP